ncbi:MAG: hypothetical protein LBB85_09590 [Dysgonamonadaceae bacterium]|jgi:hypothetical protein|nr:hypothetical protein [Dysgonamonadaceae bacterium]
MKKINKKATLGMLVAMVMSLGVMNGINSKETNDSSLQQVGVGAGYMAGVTEGGASGAWSAVSNLAVGTASGMAAVGLGSIYISGTTPVGWGYWVVTGVVGL